MNMPCRTSTPCIAAPNPQLGFDSATPDVQNEIGLGYGPPTPPPLNATFENPTCFVALDVPASQPGDAETARLLAESQSFQCAASGWKEPGGQAVQTYQSGPQSLTETCPDGSTFTFGVIPGLFTALTQAEADGAALTYCQRQIQLHKVCLWGVMPTLCVNQSADVTIAASGVSLGESGENLWELTSGEIPLGMVFNGGPVSSDSMTITGIPTETGVFMFTVKVTTPQGDFMEKSFSLTVVGVTITTAPAVQAFDPFSFQLLWVGFDAPVFTVDPSSALPAGLTMTAGGLISGTAPVAGNYTVLVDVTDAVADCQASVSIQVRPYPVFQITPDLTGHIAYFDAGTAFAAGTYRVQYVNGAWSNTSLQTYWYLNASGGLPGSASIQYTIFDSSGNYVFPGTQTPSTTQAWIEQRNNGASYTFAHSGGQIGIGQVITGAPLPGSGEQPGNPNPTFALTRIG